MESAALARTAARIDRKKSSRAPDHVASSHGMEAARLDWPRRATEGRANHLPPRGRRRCVRAGKRIGVAAAFELAVAPGPIGNAARGQERYADDTDVAVVAGTGRVRVAERAEAECGDVIVALPETVDLDRAPHGHEVAALADIRGATVENVEPVDGCDRFDAHAHLVRHDDRVALSGFADRVGVA